MTDLITKRNLQGIFLMLIASTSIATLYTSMKFVTINLNSNQATFFYKLAVFLFMLPWVFYKDGIKAIYTPNFALHFYRSIFSTAGSLTLMYSLKFIHLLDVTILTQLEQMIWLLIGAMFFNEKLNVYKILALAFGFGGGLIIVQPELVHNMIFGDHMAIPDFNKAYFFIAATIVCWSINSSLIKILGNRQATNKAQLFYVMFFASIFSYCVAFIDWNHSSFIGIPILIPANFISMSNISLDLSQLIGISIAALAYLIHSVTFFNALKYGEMTVIGPFVYFKLIFVGILAYVIFGESPRMTLSYMGYALVIAAGLVQIISQYRAHKRAKKELEGEIIL